MDEPRINTCPGCGHYNFVHEEDGGCRVMVWSNEQQQMVQCECKKKKADTCPKC